jgi:membrane fusion protein (multidrug efflux system)
MTAETVEPTPDPEPVPEIAQHEPAITPGRARRLYFILAGAVLLLLIGYAIYFFATSGKESTDDAQVAADVIPVSARIGGQVEEEPIQENQRIHRGDLIALIDPRDAEVKVQQATGDLENARAQEAAAEARASVAAATARGSLDVAQAGVTSSRESVEASADAISQARAQVAKAEANARKARLDYERAVELGNKGDIPRAQVDSARAATEAAAADVVQARAAVRSAQDARDKAVAGVQEAQGKVRQNSAVGSQISAAQADAALTRAKVRSAEAGLAAAQLALSYTRITAPADGIAARIGVHVGQQVSAGQAIVQLVPEKTYIIANFKETQVRQIRPGQRARIKLDILRDDVDGVVESVSGGTGATFSLLPPDNASGNFVKVVQRIPVRISWKGPDPSRAPVGSSAEVTVYTQ